MDHVDLHLPLVQSETSIIGNISRSICLLISQSDWSVAIGVYYEVILQPGQYGIFGTEGWPRNFVHPFFYFAHLLSHVYDGYLMCVIAFLLGLAMPLGEY